MSKAKYTIIGLENYLQYSGKSLFSGVVFPDGIDKDSAVNQILMECGEFEVLYSDPDFMTEAITLWSKNRSSTFSKWLEALETSFNPLENYDRYDEYTDIEGIKGSSSGNATNDVSAFDSSSYQPKDKTTSSNTSSTDRTLTHNLHSHGNIGVTRASQMLSEYVDVYDKYNIYQLIAADFVPRFTIMVY